MGVHRCSRTRVSHGTFSASLPAHLVGLRRAARVYLGEVASEAADDIVLTLNEAATNAILYGSGGGQPVQGRPHQRRRDRGIGA